MAGLTENHKENKEQNQELDEENIVDGTCNEVSDDEGHANASCSDPDYQEDTVSSSSHDEDEEENLSKDNSDENEGQVEDAEHEITLEDASVAATKLPERKRRKRDKLDEDQEQVEGDLPVKKKKKVKKEEHMFAKRAMALMMLLPMIIGGLAMTSEVFTHFQLDKGLVFLGCFTLGGIGALYFVLKIGMLGSFIKLTCVVAPLVFLVPTYQVYRCSPLPLKNELMGTWFKLSTAASSIAKQTYETSECFKGQRIQAPAMFSLFQARVNLTTNIDDLISLNEEEKNTDESAKRATSLFMVASKRSVNRKFHTIYLLVQASRKIAAFLDGAKKLDRDGRKRNLLVITGNIVDIGENLMPVKKELEEMKHNIRPVALVASKAAYTNRYATFKHTSGDDLS